MIGNSWKTPTISEIDHIMKSAVEIMNLPKPRYYMHSDHEEYFTRYCEHFRIPRDMFAMEFSEYIPKWPTRKKFIPDLGSFLELDDSDEALIQMMEDCGWGRYIEVEDTSRVLMYSMDLSKYEIRDNPTKLWGLDPRSLVKSSA